MLDVNGTCKSSRTTTHTRLCIKTDDDDDDDARHSRSLESPSSMKSSCYSSSISFHDDAIHSTVARGVSPMSSCVSGSVSDSCSWDALEFVVDTRLSSLVSKEKEGINGAQESAFDNCTSMWCGRNDISITANNINTHTIPIMHVESVNNSPRETDMLQQQCIHYGRFLGEGSHGSVYQALVGGEERAVKMVMCKEQDLKRVLTESELGCGLNHPNIARVFSYRVSEVCGDEDKHADHTAQYLVEIEQEMCGKGSLRQLIKNKQTFFVKGEEMSKVDSIALVTLDIVRALLYLESCGISHNDISSNNILFVSDSSRPLGLQAKVIDFGMASPLLGNTAATGTMAYMPPEAILEEHQCRDMENDKKDVYSVCVLMVEMWQNDLVWDGLLDVQILYAMSIGKRVPIPDDMPLDLSSIVHTCLSDDPKARPDVLSLYNNLCSIINYH